jgi:hypothetical protein
MVYRLHFAATAPFTSLPVKVHVMLVDAVVRAAIAIVATSGSSFRIRLIEFRRLSNVL